MNNKNRTSKRNTPDFVIFCKPQKSTGQVRFYLGRRTPDSSCEYWLFDNRYTPALYDFYRRELPLSKAIDKSNAGKDASILNVMEKLPKWVKYIEKTENCTILDKTNRKSDNHTKRTRSSRSYTDYSMSDYRFEEPVA